MRRSVALAFSLLLAPFAWAPAARAQFAPGLPPLGAPDAKQNPLAGGDPAPDELAGDELAPDELAGDGAQMARDFGRGFYDDIIHRADDLLGQQNATPDADADAVPADADGAPTDADGAPTDAAADAKSDARLYYWRGLAFYKLAWYPEAIADLTRAKAGGTESLPGGLSASASLDRIARVQPFIPPLERAISSGGQTVFRVHYVSDDAQTRAAIGSLPVSYRVSEAMFGSDVLATSVYIFDTYAQFAAFYNALVGRPPASWLAAVTINGVLCLPMRDRKGTDTLSYNPEFFRSTVAHEFNHAMLHRLMGSAEVPDWLAEGLAQVAGGTVVPNDLQTNDYNIARLFAVNALIAPQKLEDSASFKDHTTMGARLDDAGAGILAPSPYDQGYSMTRFLLANLKPGQLADLLNRVRDSGDFDKAFQDEFGATLPQFYQSWYQDTARKLRR